MEAKKSERERLRELVSSAMSTKRVTGVPENFTFHPTMPYLYFIGLEPDQSSSSLYYVDVSQQTGKEPAEWQQLVTSDVTEREHQLSREEELLRERMRAVGFGITSYSFDPSSSQFLIPASGTYYTLDVSGQPEGKRIVPKEITTKLSGARMDAKQNPNDPSIVSYVVDGDIWLVDTKTDAEKRLTHCRKDPKDDTISSGVAEFIIQEEFDRYTGYWWQNSQKEEEKKSGLCRLLYLEVDESEVELYSIPQASSISGETEKFRYPLAGAKNAVSRVCIVEHDASKFEEASPVIRRLSPPLSVRYPDCEYVVRAGWTKATPGADQCVWLQLLDRKQQKLQFVTIPLSEFRAEGEENTTPNTDTTLFEDTTDIWINVTDLIYYLSDGRIIWGSEVPTGYRHLYLIDPANPKERKAITQGDWQVDDVALQVDEKRSLVYFVGTKDTPIEAHLYVASFAPNADPNKIHRLTAPGFYHSGIKLSAAFDKFVSVHSNLQTPHNASVTSIQWPENNDLFEPPTLTKLFDIVIPRSTNEPPFPALPPEPFTFTNSTGETAYGIYFKPPDYEEGKQYPTLLYVYGGPHVQLVVNSYSITRVNKKWQLLASEGYVVVIIDGIGSWRRGLKWEGHLRLKMGQVEIHDQILGLESLMKTKNLIDKSRIGVTGWSYGGYLSLNFLAQRPDFFKVSIAGGPVSLWEAYDTGYTERYMDTPQNNPEGYAKGSLLSIINGFPQEENRLLIVHGLIDENVHFCHTAKLIDWLLDVGAPYQLQVYPSERHGVRSPHAALHWELTSVSFVKNHL